MHGSPGDPRHGFAEATVIAGARAGKDSRIGCPIAGFEACFGNHDKELGRGEYATIPLIAQDQRATRIAFNYLKDYFTESSLLKSMLDSDPYSNEIRLKNRISIVCFPSTLASLRGWSIPVAILDEVGFWRVEGSADADVEILSSVRRGMINFAHSRLVKISSPYMKSGILYDDYKNHFSNNSQDILVWRASSTFMNPRLTDAKMDAERRKDPIRFQREYQAEFAEDLEMFLPAAWIEGAVIKNRHELAPQPGLRYVAAVDVTGLGSGANADSFTLVVGHYEKEIFIQDLCKGWKKSRNLNIDLEGIVKEIADILKHYGTREVHGDKYSNKWVVEAFQRAGVMYRQLESGKSEYYLGLEPIFATGRIEILDHPDLIRELRMLERRAHPGGRTSVDHPPNRHDDHANALAIACAKAKRAINMWGYPTGPTKKNEFGISAFGPKSGEAERPRGNIPYPIGVGNTGISLGQRDDDEHYVGAKPVR